MSNWEITALRIINVACRESARQHARVLREKRLKHDLYGMEHRAVFRDCRRAAL